MWLLYSEIIFNSIHIFSICMQYSLLNIPEGCVRLDSLETGFEVESCIQRLIGSACGWYACQEERGQAVTKLALGPLAHCAQSQFTDTWLIWKIFSLWVCFEQLWDPFSLMNIILLSLLSAIFPQTLRNWEFSPPDPFHCGSFNLHESSITFPVLLGGHGVALWSEWRSQSWTDWGFSVQVYILGWLADFFLAPVLPSVKRRKG